MAKATNKTQKTGADAWEYLSAIPGEVQREDCLKIANLMKAVSHEEPKMWGPAIVGFGDMHLKYESGREGGWFKIGFSPRKSATVLYLHTDLSRHEDLLARAGKVKREGSCLHIKKLMDVNLDVLEKLLEAVMAEKKA